MAEDRSEKTFLFISDTSESEEEVVFETLPKNEHGTGHLQSSSLSGGHKVPDYDDRESNTERKGHQLRENTESKSNKRMLKLNQEETLEDKLEEVAHHQKRNKILFQLVCSSAVVMLQMQGGMAWFWNSLLLNISGIQLQTPVMWCFLIGYIISCVISLYINDKLGIPYKWLLALGCVISMLYSAVRVVPNVYVVSGLALIFGLTIAPFHSAATLQITKLAEAYESYRGGKFKTSLAHFTGMALSWISFAPTWFSIMHAVIGVSNDSPNNLRKPSHCGFDYIWDWSDVGKSHDGIAPENYGAQPLLGAAIVSAFGGIIISVLVLNEIALPSKQPNVSYRDSRPNNPLKKLGDVKFLVVFPIACNLGLYQLFCYTVFLQAFVACNFGIRDLFFIAICIGLGSTATSYPWAWMGNRFGRAKLLVIGHILVVLLLLAVFMGGFILPYAAFYMVGFIMGILDALLQTQCANLFSVVFHANSTMCLSIVHLARACGICAIFTIIRYHGENSLACEVIIAIAVVATICHIVLEIKLGLMSENSRATSPDTDGTYVLLNDPKWLPDVDPTSLKPERISDLLPKIPLLDNEEYEHMDERRD